MSEVWISGPSFILNIAWHRANVLISSFPQVSSSEHMVTGETHVLIDVFCMSNKSGSRVNPDYHGLPLFDERQCDVRMTCVADIQVAIGTTNSR